MGGGKPVVETPEERWRSLALVNGFACSRCGETPSHPERETYFKTGLCGWCKRITDLEKEPVDQLRP